MLCCLCQKVPQITLAGPNEQRQHHRSLRDRDALLEEFDMYEACGAGFPEPTEYLRKMLQITQQDGLKGEAWTYIYNWPVDGLPRIASGKFLEA